MITFNHVSKSYDQNQTFLVKDLSFQVFQGEILVILGTSGCGKTTTLKLINRLIEPSSGEIRLHDSPLQNYDPIQLRSKIGYVFQSIGLFPHMSVAENVAISARLHKQSKRERTSLAEKYLQLVNLDPALYANRMPHELSGGQQQRVGVARALASDPEILLMDEPFGAVDSITRLGLQEELLRLNTELHKTILFVTHDIFEAFKLADRILIMQQGRIEHLGTKQSLIQAPASEFSAKLLATATQQVKQIADWLLTP